MKIPEQAGRPRGRRHRPLLAEAASDNIAMERASRLDIDLAQLTE